jgi:phosphoglucomutase
MNISPYAGKPADPGMLINIPRLVTAYYVNRPDPAVPAHRVAFGTSGHRGSSLDHAFNEAHILAITQAICLYRKQQSFHDCRLGRANPHGPVFGLRHGAAD